MNSSIPCLFGDDQTFYLATDSGISTCVEETAPMNGNANRRNFYHQKWNDMRLFSAHVRCYVSA